MAKLLTTLNLMFILQHMQPEQVQESEPVAVSCQTELESCDVVSKKEYDKFKEEMESIKKEHHELLLRYAEKEVEKMSADHPAFIEDYFRDNDDKVRFFPRAAPSL